MRIKAAVDNVDLRTITHHVHFLEECKREYKLQRDGDAAIFNGKSDRYRLVVIIAGRPMLVMPETDLDNRISRYLRVSIHLSKLDGTGTDFFSDHIIAAKARIARQKVRAKRAAEILAARRKR